MPENGVNARCHKESHVGSELSLHETEPKRWEGNVYLSLRKDRLPRLSHPGMPQALAPASRERGRRQVSLAYAVTKPRVSQAADPVGTHIHTGTMGPGHREAHLPWHEARRAAKFPTPAPRPALLGCPGLAPLPLGHPDWSIHAASRAEKRRYRSSPQAHRYPNPLARAIDAALRLPSLPHQAILNPQTTA